MGLGLLLIRAFHLSIEWFIISSLDVPLPMPEFMKRKIQVCMKVKS